MCPNQICSVEARMHVVRQNCILVLFLFCSRWPPIFAKKTIQGYFCRKPLETSYQGEMQRHDVENMPFFGIMS